MIGCHGNTLEGIEKDCSQPGWYYKNLRFFEQKLAK